MLVILPANMKHQIGTAGYKTRSKTSGVEPPEMELPSGKTDFKIMRKLPHRLRLYRHKQKHNLANIDYAMLKCLK